MSDHDSESRATTHRGQPSPPFHGQYRPGRVQTSQERSHEIVSVITDDVRGTVWVARCKRAFVATYMNVTVGPGEPTTPDAAVPYPPCDMCALVSAAASDAPTKPRTAGTPNAAVCKALTWQALLLHQKLDDLVHDLSRGRYTVDEGTDLADALEAFGSQVRSALLPHTIEPGESDK